MYPKIWEWEWWGETLEFVAGICACGVVFVFVKGGVLALWHLFF
jgi:hypothetical protein